MFRQSSRQLIRAAAAGAGRSTLPAGHEFIACQATLQNERVIPIRFFAKEANATPLKGDEMLKNIFYEVKQKFEAAISVFRKESIILDPDDPAAVSQYAKVLKMAREKAGGLSQSEKIKYTIQQRTKDIPDARTYLLTLEDIRVKSGMTNHLGAGAMMMDALEKVEKEIKKPLLRSDKKNMALLLAEFDKINKKLGIRKEDLPKVEEELELDMAKADLERIKKEVVEAMEAQLKREEFKDEKMPDLRTLDVRNWL